jgi:hypothetical protein
MKELVTWKTALWVFIGALVFWVWRPFSPSTEEWDRRIDAMCAERWPPNKAYKVYVTEKIVPPKSYFTSDMSRFNGPKPDDEISRNNLPDNPLIWQMTEIEVINESKPRVSVYAVQYVRQSDRKVVGEAYQVIRAGTSDWIELGYLNRKVCPGDFSGNHMITELFEGLLPSHFGVMPTNKGREK